MNTGQCIIASVRSSSSRVFAMRTIMVILIAIMIFMQAVDGFDMYDNQQYGLLAGSVEQTKSE